MKFRVECRYCKESFETDHAKTKYCNKICSKAYNKGCRYEDELKICRACGEIFNVTTHNKTTCSNECVHKYYDMLEAKYSNTKCKVCGVGFKTDSKSKLYCSKPCREKFHEYLPIKKVSEKNCILCKSSIDNPDHGSLYCSSKCREKGQQKHDCKCEICGLIYISYKDSKYCSDKCKYSNVIEKTCIFCGAKFKVNSTKKSRKYCSSECSYCFQLNKIKVKQENQSKLQTNNLEELVKFRVDAIIDKLHDDESSIFRDNYESKFITNKEKTKERDRWKCQVCEKDYGIEVHHITPRSWGGSHELYNLISLCTSCHRSIETKDKYHAYTQCLKQAKRYAGLLENDETPKIEYFTLLKQLFKMISQNKNDEAMIEISKVLDDMEEKE